jgi:hypothetical protein
MATAPFEQYIKHLLDQTAAADALRDLANKNIPILQNSNLMKTVDAVLMEEAIAAQFDYNGYENLDQKLKVLSKLKKVLDSISDTQSNDYLVVYLCYKYVNDGYSLTKDITKLLNDIWKKYD